MRRISMLLALIALFTACATPAERAAQAQREVDEMILTYGPACERLGYKGDTDPWRDCMLRLRTQDRLERIQSHPMMTTCFGDRGFLHCSTF